MDAPLAAHRVVRDGQQLMDVWTDGTRHRVEAPFPPYYWTLDRPASEEVLRCEPRTVRPLGSLEEETWFRVEVPTVHHVSEANRDETPGRMADNHVAYVERVLLDEPDWYRRFAQTDPLRVLTLDVEQRTEGRGFPPRDAPLVSLAWRTEVLDEDPGGTEVRLGDGETDRDLLEALLDAVRAFDPDLLVGYNLAGYDLPVLEARLHAHGLDPAGLSRTDEAPDLRSGRGGPHVDGRLVYDVLDPVRRDQTLHGIKDRRLATVADWMGLDVVDADASDTASLVGTDELARYNANDVDVTRDLLHVYLPNHLELADLYGAPLNLVLRATSSFHTRVLQGRVLHELGIVSDGRNDERYPDLYAQTSGQAFVGGLVELHQRGRFEPVWHVDFSSMYPSIMVALGCGADNTRHLGTVARAPFQVTRGGDATVLTVPDDARDVSHRLEVRGVSPLARELGDLLDRRLRLKREMQAVDDPDERARLHARQHALKVVLNSVYGVMASPHARYGSLPVAVATVGTARQLVRRVQDHLGDACIETDTDGVYAAEPVDEDAINARVRAYAEDLFGEGSGDPLHLEVERYRAGWFHQAKNYLLLTRDDRLVKHGVAFHGSSHPGVFDRTLERVGRAKLAGDEDPVEAARAMLDLTTYAPEDFVMRLRLGKDPEDYVERNALGAQLARAARRHLDLDPGRGTRLEYVKTRRGYDVVRPEAMRRLDEAYYRELVRKVLDRLDVDPGPGEQSTLGAWT